MKNLKLTGLTIALALTMDAAWPAADRTQQTASDEMTEVRTTAKQQVDASQRRCMKNDVYQGISFSWCIDTPATADRTRILYFLHGNGGSEFTLLDSPVYWALQDRWKAQNVQPPVIIAMSFGPRWLLTDLPSNYVQGRPVLLDFFTKSLMPYLEQKLTTSNALRITQSNTGTSLTRRMLMGVSMGSYNSGLLVEHTSSLFQKVVLGCPGFFTSVNPFSPQEDIAAYVARTAADPSWVTLGLQVLGFDELGLQLADWQRNDPLERVTALTSLSPPVLVWYNDHDQFGFEEGAAEFANSAGLLGVPVEVMHNDGKHCLIDPAMEDRIAAFLK